MMPVKQVGKKVMVVDDDYLTCEMLTALLGGVEILRSMQEAGQGKIPVIVISARHLDQATKEMIKMEGNVMGVVGKPFQHDIFVKAIHHILGTKPQYAN